MIIVQLLARFRDVDGLLRGFAPGDFQAHVQIPAQDGGFGGTEGLSGKPPQLLEELFADFLAHGQVCDLLTVELDIVVLAQLGLDDFHFFPEVIIPLIAVHGLLRLLGQLLLNIEDAQLPRQHAVDESKAAGGIPLLQQHLAILNAQPYVLRQIVGDVSRIGIGQQIDDLLADHVAVEMDVLIKLGQTAPQQRLRPFGAHTLGLVLPGFDIGIIRFGVAVHALRLCAVEPLHHHPADVAARLTQLLADAADGADGIDFLLLRQIRAKILLRCQEDELIRPYGVVERRDGGRPLHIKGEKHARKHMQAPQGKQRHFDQLLFVLCHVVSFLSAVVFRRRLRQAAFLFSPASFQARPAQSCRPHE